MSWAITRLGTERITYAYAYKKLLQQNGWIPLGTDFPVEEVSPLYTFYAAVSRKDSRGLPPAGFQVENALSREEALRGITIWPAKAAFEEQEKGSIEPGKFADFVLLDADLLKDDLISIRNATIRATYLDGQKVH
jgi:predicted amidohydrolase YtcJ